MSDEAQPSGENVAVPMSAEGAAAALERLFGGHQECTWVQVGGCVYCRDHTFTRLYHGDLPESRRT
jgi:hypothetical protein